MKNTHLLILVGCAWLTGCTESTRVVPGGVTNPATLEAMYQEIYDLVQNPSCTDTSECASLPLGSKPCGGPWKYLVYSQSTVNEAELQAMAIQLAQYEELYNQEYHVVSLCNLARVADPACINGKCVDLNLSP